MRHAEGQPGLHTLARLHGIQTSYRDVAGRRVPASDTTLAALLRSLGVPVETTADRRSAVREERLRRCEQLIEPVLVAWDGSLSPFNLWLRADEAPQVHLSLTGEDGAPLQCEDTSVHIRDSGLVECEGRRYRSLLVHVDTVLPNGYHRLLCEAGARSAHAHVLSAPSHVYRPPGTPQRQWGVFLPLYALRTAADWGAGSYADLERLVEWTAHQGGSLVGTLPLLPCFHGGAGEVSPYLPVTRLLWNEFFADIESAPNLAECTEALQLLQSRQVAQAREQLRRLSFVDYAGVWELKRTMLAALARHAWSGGSRLKDGLDAFLRTHDVVRDYAAFRGAAERQARPWREWQSPASGGDLSPDYVDAEVRRFYEYAQWIAHLQMSSAAPRTTDSRTGLYLDLPLGVHPDGYDAWRYQHSFVPETSCGAPPDVLFTTGQDWGSPPPHPEAIRHRGYDYFRAVVDHHMSSAAALRIDHVMGLHHIFCIPAGRTSAEGTYLRYHADEMYAVLSIESHRHRVSIVGEDLGTVPQEVRRAMRRHRLNRMFVLHYELEGMTGEHRLRVPQNCLAALNTHDMPPFASMWRGLDICQQADLGILARDDIDDAVRKRQQLKQSLLSLLPRSQRREPADVLDVLRCTLRWLGAQRACFVLLNLEDLWLETRQPNVPGVGAAYPSWRHRAARSMEELQDSAEVHALLDVVRRARRDHNEDPGGES